MSPPSHGCKVPVTPTFVSTDLITPGRHHRETLPAIGCHSKDQKISKLWGHETKLTEQGDIAYSCFKPSHLCTDNVIVTHRHYGNRISFIEANEQPYNVTSLHLSKCRINDQCMPPPLQSHLPQEYFIAEPCPDYLRNNYFSHRCKFQLFPTNGVDLRDAAEPKEKFLTKEKSEVSPNTRRALNDIANQLYNTTTYQKNFPSQVNHRKRRYFKSCQNCVNNKLKTDSKVDKTSKLLQRPKMDKYLHRKPKEVAWPSWPLGENNITNNPPGYPKIKLPKYSYETARSRSHHCPVCCNSADNQTVTDADDSNEDVEDNDSTEKSCSQLSEECHERDYKTSGEKENSLEHQASSVDETTNESEEGLTLKRTSKLTAKDVSSLDLNQRLYQLIISKAKQRFDYEHGFKTEAHKRYHEMYPQKLPDLRDADTEGRRHHYCGINVHLFRG